MDLVAKMPSLEGLFAPVDGSPRLQHFAEIRLDTSAGGIWSRALEGGTLHVGPKSVGESRGVGVQEPLRPSSSRFQGAPRGTARVIPAFPGCMTHGSKPNPLSHAAL